MWKNHLDFMELKNHPKISGNGGMSSQAVAGELDVGDSTATDTVETDRRTGEVESEGVQGVQSPSSNETPSESVDVVEN